MVGRIVESLYDSPDGAEHNRFSNFPWREWTDGQTRELTQGEDFTVAVSTFRVYLYQYKDLMNDMDLVRAGKVYTPDPDVSTWVVNTRIVAPNVIRFCFSSSEEPKFVDD